VNRVRAQAQDAGLRHASLVRGMPLLVLVALVAVGTSGALGRGLGVRGGEFAPERRVTRTLHDAYSRVARPLAAVKPRLVAPPSVCRISSPRTVAQAGAARATGLSQPARAIDRIVLVRLNLPPPASLA
jgi:hypothetical protein